MSYTIDPAYVEVPERWHRFRKKHPEAYMTSEIVGVYEFPSGTFIAVKAYVHTSKDDQHPATGLAWEITPGRTPFTKDSELMNAETSAWGRALVAHGEVAKDEKFASAHEVRMRQQSPKDSDATAPRSASDRDRGRGSASQASPSGPGLVAPWTTKGKYKTNPDAVLRIVELEGEKDEEGWWPQVCPYCLGDVEEGELGGKPAFKCTNWRECVGGRRRGVDSSGQRTKADSPDGWWAWTGFASDDIWAPHGRIDQLVAHYRGDIEKVKGDKADVPDSPDEFGPEQEPIEYGPDEEPF